MKIKVINGANINMLGIREKGIYGNESYEDLENLIKDWSKKKKIDVDIFQSNHEGLIIDEIQSTYFENYDGIVINPGAYTHTSIGIRDALLAVKKFSVEVHITDINERESFRKFSYISDVVLKSIIGKGIYGYIDALEILEKYLNEENFN